MRKWFQFHLSTAIVLTLAASAILWMNLREWGRAIWGPYRGWPLVYYVSKRDDLFFWPWPALDILWALVLLLAIALSIRARQLRCSWRKTILGTLGVLCVGYLIWYPAVVIAFPKEGFQFGWPFRGEHGLECLLQRK